METTKIDSIQIWPTPKNIKDLQKLLKFIKFYQNMISKYAEWISAITIFFAKKQKNWMATNPSVKVNTIEKTIYYEPTIGNTRPKKTYKII